jgi:hypothetical protein
MSINKMNLKEYKKYYVREAIWLETNDGKSHFLSDAVQMYKIYPILMKYCQNKLENIDIDENINKRFGKYKLGSGIDG